MDAKEIFRRASEKNASISLATVYRNLHLFKEYGLIDQKHFGQVRCSYEVKRSNEHQHLLCQGCGQVIEFESSLIRKLAAEVERKNNFYVSKVDLYLEGYCFKCKEQKK